ncbi:hypothetical protein PVMG_05412 [Plasmodium vivax Mauritania I]|uniref:PIR Superfamily Protein n=1 Tax=Plasmodium vivax Mauritania I TaxID=1035515 RepID=A0A0J9TFW4_PLAVI|nr:hypothetical protein PVMG_05412 [Plasmodium vivax Mauritania I]
MKETNLISDLPSYEFYSKFNNNKSDTVYSIECSNISTDSSEQQELSTICTNLGKNIYYLENEVAQDESLFDKHCYDLNYWLHDQVTRALVKDKDKNNIYSVFEKIQNKWGNIDRQGKPDNKKKTCMPESKLFRTGTFKHFKQLLDYFENYQKIEQEISKSSEQHHKYCSYILQIVSLYFTLKELCSKINIDICNKYVENYNNYNPSKLLAKLSCEEGKTYEVQFDEKFVKEMIYTYQPDFGKIFQNLDLVQKGFDGSGIKALFNKIPYLSDIYNYDIIHKYVVPALYGLGSLLFFFFLYRVK